MSILNTLFKQKRTITKPIFMKDFSKENTQLKDLEELKELLRDGEKKDLIERDIMFLKQGISGESNTYYELQNSFMPMLCLHDVRIQHENYVAQLDFIVITNKFVAILETKKLNGNITINRDGDFIRTIRTKRGKEIKEGMYSPVSQNKRHINIVKDALSKRLNINNMPLISLVVIANPSSIINKDKCPNDIKYSIYKHDQIIKQLEKYQNDKKNESNFEEKYMYQIANLLADMNTPISFNNKDKYGLVDSDYINANIDTTIALEKPIIEPKYEKTMEIKKVVVIESTRTVKKSKEELTQELKKYRLKTSTSEGIAAYYIFNNAEMEDLIDKSPINEAELTKVKGFGPKKIEKYGVDILKIIAED